MFAVIFDKFTSMFHSILLFLEKMLDDTPVLLSIALAIFFSSITFTIFYFIKENFFRLTRFNTGGIVLLEGVRNGSKPLRIASNPNDINYIEMPRSYNEKDGTEFTYNIWFVINKANTGGEWSHLFHKGSPNGYPLRAPGAWIKGNTLKISMNTVEQIDNSVDIKNIPVKKWCMLTITLRGHILEIFLNGYLKETIDFGTKIPRLNDESVYFTHWGGFKGYIANANYFNYAVDGSEIRNLFQDGPATDGCSVGFDVPPYLATGENIQSECNK